MPTTSFMDDEEWLCYWKPIFGNRRNLQRWQKVHDELMLETYIAERFGA